MIAIGSFLSIALFSILLLAGCATPYQVDSALGGIGLKMEGGFSEFQVDPNRWVVRFRGNSKVSPEKARDLCLLRASELYLDNGYTHFSIVEEKLNNKKIVEKRPRIKRTRAGIEDNNRTSVSSSRQESPMGSKKVVYYDTLVKFSYNSTPESINASDAQESISKQYRIR